MNRFKSNASDPKAQDYSRRKEEVQLLTILDKCTQILRDDRIWLRNKVKECDAEVLQIFKKYLGKRPGDLSVLQVNLRKYVTRVKERAKKDQLQRFKENLHSATANTLLFERQGNGDRNAKSIEGRRPGNSKFSCYEEEEEKRENARGAGGVNRLRNLFRDQSRQEEKRRGTSGRKLQFEGLKMTEPIVEDEEMEQVWSNRSKSEFNTQGRPKTSQRGASERVVDVKEGKQQQVLGGGGGGGGSWLKPGNYNTLVQKQRELELQLDEEQGIEHYTRFPEPMAFSKKEADPPTVQFSSSSGYQKNVSRPFGERIYQIEESQVESNLMNSELTSQANSKVLFESHQTYEYDTFAHESKIEMNSRVSPGALELPSFSNTPAASTATDRNFFPPSVKPPLSVAPVNNNFGSSNYQYVIEDEHQLFTNPSLLEECKKFMQGSGSEVGSSKESRSREESMKGSGIEKKGETENLGSNCSEYGGLAFKARDCNSETKLDSVVPPHPVYQQKYSVNPLPYLGVVESFQREERGEPETSNLIPDISKLYAEEVFDIIFASPSPSPSPSIPFSKYSQIVHENFLQQDKLIKLFRLGDKHSNNTLLATDFGRLLLTNCNYKPSPNPVKQIFSLIDIDRKGYFTLDDYERFLEQVVDAEEEGSAEVIEVCERLFQMADVGQGERVEYWGLYLVRGTEEFGEFNRFLEQFEFEFEVA